LGQELGGGVEDAAATMGDPHGMATTEHSIRSYLDGDVSLKLPIPGAHAASGAASRRHGDEVPASLIACSRCLRVLRDEKWVRAETVIGELRTFQCGAPPHFEAVLCPLCSSSLRLYRGAARVRGRR
jgi:hypothetical protein